MNYTARMPSMLPSQKRRKTTPLNCRPLSPLAVDMARCRIAGRSGSVGAGEEAEADGTEECEGWTACPGPLSLLWRIWGSSLKLSARLRPAGEEALRCGEEPLLAGEAGAGDLVAAGAAGGGASLVTFSSSAMLIPTI